MTEVVAVVLNFNDRDATKRCVLSLLSGSRVPSRVVVVDNGSTQVPALSLDGFSGSVEVVRLETNLGYAGGNNVGVAAALRHTPDFVWILNNDTSVHRDCLEKILDAIASSPCDEEAVFLTGVRHEGLNQWWFLGGWIDRRTGTVWHTPQTPIVGDVVPTAYIAGCSFIAPSVTFKRVGGFDESLFLYCEDVDWSIRAMALGVRPVLVPQAVVDHVGGGSTRVGRRSQSVPYFFKARNRLWLARRGTYRLSATVVATPRWVARELRAARRETPPRSISAVASGLMRGLFAGLHPKMPKPAAGEFSSATDEP